MTCYFCKTNSYWVYSVDLTVTFVNAWKGCFQQNKRADFPLRILTIGQHVGIYTSIEAAQLKFSNSWSRKETAEDQIVFIYRKLPLNNIFLMLQYPS